MADFLTLKVIFIKFCKELNIFFLLHVAQALGIIQLLRNASRGEGDSDYFMMRYREVKGVSSDTVT